MAADAWRRHLLEVKIGPYETLGELGRGGMGIVYRARSPDGRLVAVKVVVTQDPETLLRFEREQRLQGALDERAGFVPLLDSGRTAHGPFLVMPLLGGGTLRERLDGGRLGIDESVELARSLARSVGMAHRLGIVHRDLKPENVIFTEEGRPLVADLGLGKHFVHGGVRASRSVSLSASAQILGTAGYLAPEQIDDSKTVGPPADVFALGAILYECLSGQRVFDAVGAVARLVQTTEGRIVPLRKLRPEVPEKLAAAVHRALAADSRDRFPGALALLDALAETKLAKHPRKPLLLASAVAALLVLAVAGGAMLGVGRRPEKPTASIGPKADAEPIKPVRELASTWYDRGIEREKANDWKGEIACMTRAIELDPKLSRGWIARGFARSRTNDLDGTIADLTKAIELDPGEFMVWVVRGHARGERGDFQGEIDDDTRAIELHSESNLAFCNRGYARGRLGDWDGDIADQTEAIERAPRYAPAWENRGEARGKKGDFDGAIDDETRAIALFPGFADAWANRGLARIEKGDRDGGIADLERSIALAPGSYLAPAIRERLDELKGPR